MFWDFYRVLILCFILILCNVHNVYITDGKHMKGGISFGFGKENEVYTIDITGMTHEGQGVGRIDNFTVFVDGPVEGEKVEIKIIR